MRLSLLHIRIVGVVILLMVVLIVLKIWQYRLRRKRRLARKHAPLKYVYSPYHHKERSE